MTSFNITTIVDRNGINSEIMITNKKVKFYLK